MRTLHRLLVAVLLLPIGIACAATPPEPQPAPEAVQPPYAPVATIKDLMQAIVDPSADVVWNAAATVVDKNGTDDKAPRSDEEWAAVRQGAIALVEASNLLLMPGRHVARAGEKSDTPGVELEPAEMEVLIDKDRPSWEAHAKALHDTTLLALQAIDAQDSKALFEVGADIDSACESCHKQYWYPNEKIPEVPKDL